MRYLIAILLVTIASSTLIAQDQPDDTQVTTHDISQTQDDVTVTLDQTYADTKQIQAWFTIDGIDLPEGRLMGAPIVFIRPLLTDYPGTEIGSMGKSVDFNDGTMTVFSTFEVDMPLNELIDVVLNVRIEQPEGVPLYLVPDDVPNEGSINPDYEYELPYNINVSLPVTLNPFQSNTIITNFSEESNDLSLSIDETVVTPQFAQIPVCFDLPDNRDWQPDIMLEIDDEIVQPSGFSLEGLPSPEDIERCTTFSFNFSFIDSIESLTIIIDGYVGNRPDVIDDADIARAQERLQGTGIVVEYGGATRGIGVNVIDYPDSLPENEAYMQAWDVLRDRHDGYWAFDLTIDSASFERAE